MFFSLLSPRETERKRMDAPMPAYFRDLGIEPLIEGIRPYCADLSPYFDPVCDVETVLYRQEICKNLEPLPLRQRFTSFSRQMIALHKEMEAGSYPELPYLYSCSLLAYAKQYVEQLNRFLQDFPYRLLYARGLYEFVLYIRQCLGRPELVRMRKELLSMERELHGVELTMLLNEDIALCDNAPAAESMEAYLHDVWTQFEVPHHASAFCQAPAGESDVRSHNAVLSMLAERYPALSKRLLQFGCDFAHFFDERLFCAVKELTFYTSWLNHTDQFMRAGCQFCYPSLLDGWEGCFVEDCFDLSLAGKLAELGKIPVTNSFALGRDERLVVITGPNQGGKTTFTRMLGQLFFLSSLGLRVAGRGAAVHLASAIYTHFLHLGDCGVNDLDTELRRILEILSKASRDSLVLINEIFASAPHGDGLYLGKEICKGLKQKGCLTICVTFLSELAAYDPHTVSLVSKARGDETRTYKLTREPPDGCAHALSLLKSKGLTFEQIVERIPE